MSIFQSHNHENRPKQLEWDDIHFTHIAIPTSLYIFFNIEVCVLLEHVCILYKVVCAAGIGSKLLRGGSPVKACVGLALVVVFPVTSLFVTKWDGTASIHSRVLVNTAGKLRVLCVRLFMSAIPHRIWRFFVFESL